MARSPRFVIVFVISMLALSALACNLPGSSDTPAGGDAPAAAANAPVVDIRVPVNGMSFAEGTNVIIQTVGTDAGAGVSRIDLLIDDVAYGSNTAPTAAGQSAFITNFEWVAEGQGLHSITAIAYRQDETASTAATISVNVVAAQPTDVPPTATPEVTEVVTEEAPEPEAQAEEPTAEPTAEPTQDTSPRGTTTIGLNVRNGDSTFHAILGALPNGSEVDLLARNADSTWFVVPFGLTEGWVSAFYIDVADGVDVNGLPVRTAPPAPPTSTPVPTAVPATAVPPTATGPSVDFRSTVGDGQTYPSGTCFTFYWTATGISEVYFDGQGVPGQGQREVCPTASRSYTLRVVYTDGSTREFTIPVGIN
jgi:uncharacterized protein YraI